MRTASFLIVVLALGAICNTAQRAEAPSNIRAWSDTAGPDGKTWNLEMKRDGSATVLAFSGPGSKSAERRFKIPVEQYAAILGVTDEAGFFALPPYLGPSAIPLHGPENVLRIAIAGKEHQVALRDPLSAKGEEAARFQRVWRAVVAWSPVKPPL